MACRDDRLSWFKAVILPHRAALRSRILRIAPAGFDVDDLIAETLARAYAVADWRTVENGRAYLFRISRNLLIDAARRETIVSFDFVADLELLQVDNSTVTGLTARDELRTLQRIVDTLPAQCRTVFLQRRVHDRSMPSIAEALGLSVSTVEKHLAKAILLIRTELARIEDDGDTRSLPAPGRAPGDRGAGGGVRGAARGRTRG